MRCEYCSRDGNRGGAEPSAPAKGRHAERGHVNVIDSVPRTNVYCVPNPIPHILSAEVLYRIPSIQI